MNNDATTSHVFGFSPSQKNLNAITGILGIYGLGIFLLWYIATVLHLPMPESMIGRSAVNAIFQTALTVFFPYIWAVRRMRFSLRDLGVSRSGLLASTVSGCLLYSLALAAFMHCSADPLISNHALGKLDIGGAIGLLSSMSLISAGTDFATRGFLLLALARYAGIPFAVCIQNISWYVGHIPEINLLSNCLGFWMAAGLTLTLGIVGDVIALKTRNVIGLAIAHILLNVVLTVFIRTS